MRGAGIEPHVERVFDFFVVRGISAEQLFGLHGLPCFDAAFLDTQRDLFQKFQCARMQRAGFLVDKKRHRHAPLPLARERPVRAIGDHTVQPCLSPGGEKFRVFNAAQRGRAQGLGRLHLIPARRIVHAGEPLYRRAQNHRRLVAPAVHVAVQVLRLIEQHTFFVKVRDDFGVGFPDHLAAKQRQRRNIFSVAHHRRLDVHVFHAVAAA